MAKRPLILKPGAIVSEEELQITSMPSSDKYELITPEAISRRQIHIIDDITDTTFERVKNLYDYLVEDDSEKPIHIIIGTIGGDVRSMLGIMNILLLSKTPCYTYLLGETCSAGSWIYLCGSKRFAPKTNLVSYMLHPMEWDVSLNLGTHNAHNKYVENLCKNLATLTAERTNIPKSVLKQLTTTKTVYFIGEELFTLGIATDVLESYPMWLNEAHKEPKSKNKTKKSQVLTETITKDK